MKKSIFIASAVLMFLGMGNHASVGVEIGPEERAIRKEAREFAEAYNQGKAEVLAAQWTKDGEYTIGQRTVKGRDAIAKLYAAFLRANPGSKMEIKVASVRVIAPTVAIEEGTTSVTGGANGPASASSYSAVHVKQGDKWPMVTVRESEMPSLQLDRELKELEWMVGKWSAGKDGAQAALACEWMANKRFLRAEIAIRGKDRELPGGTQIIGRDPASGQIVSWFFSADGGYGTGVWQKDGSRWIIKSVGITGDGTLTAGTTSLYRADENVASWQSFNRVRGHTRLPDVKEVVIERVQANN
jgi:uncharacterized protein (TIGR02246 family)